MTLDKRFIYKWASVGAGVVTFLFAISIPIAQSTLKKNHEAVKRFHEDSARAAKAVAEREKAEKEAVTRASLNWEQWKASFVGSNIATACYHSFTKKPLLYTIKCHVGPKGQLPILVVTCDQHICAK